MSAYRKIVKLVPNMANLISRLSNTLQSASDDIHDSMLFKFVELVSNVIILRRSFC